MNHRFKKTDGHQFQKPMKHMKMPHEIQIKSPVVHLMNVY
jgi:hypothetical protein